MIERFREGRSVERSSHEEEKGEERHTGEKGKAKEMKKKGKKGETRAIPSAHGSSRGREKERW